MKEEKDNEVIRDDSDCLYSVDEVKQKLGTSAEFVRRLIKVKMLTAIYFGRNIKIRKYALNEFLKKFDGYDLIGEVKKREAEMGIAA